MQVTKPYIWNFSTIYGFANDVSKFFLQRLVMTSNDTPFRGNLNKGFRV